jgi:hypothetical protein
VSDIVQRLRDQGKDAFAKHYSLGMFKLCDEAADEIERLRLVFEQVKTVCFDNAADTVRHDLALKFVGKLADKGLSRSFVDVSRSGVTNDV